MEAPIQCLLFMLKIFTNNFDLYLETSKMYIQIFDIKVQSCKLHCTQFCQPYCQWERGGGGGLGPQSLNSWLSFNTTYSGTPSERI